MIYHLKSPSLPGYRFEYHPEVKKVYVIRVGQQPEIAEILAQNVPDHGAAWNMVSIWARGYREHERMAALARPAENLMVV